MGADDGYVRWQCNMCGKKLKAHVGKEGGGQIIFCPRCGEQVAVPMVELKDDLKKVAEEVGRDKEIYEAFGTEKGFERAKRKMEQFLSLRRKAPVKSHVDERRGERVDWKPVPKLPPTQTFAELDSFWRKVKLLQDDVYVRVCAILTDPGLSPEKKRERVLAIATYHNDKAVKIYRKYREVILHELAKSDGGQGQGKSRGKGRLENVLDALDLFARNVLRLPPPE